MTIQMIGYNDCSAIKELNVSEEIFKETYGDQIADALVRALVDYAGCANDNALEQQAEKKRGLEKDPTQDYGDGGAWWATEAGRAMIAADL
jgi:hypothetical protein